MKKSAFLHATCKLKNAINLPSLIQETIPEGLFSKIRLHSNDREELLLEGTLKDLLLSQELDEIIVVTSNDSCDDWVKEVCEHVKSTKKVSCCRIEDDKPFAVIETNRTYSDYHWPYLSFQNYGAWHLKGFFEIVKAYQTDLAFILQADSSLCLDISWIDEWLCHHAMKGFYGKSRDLLGVDFAIVNYSFMEGLYKKYQKKLERNYELRKNLNAFYIQSLLDLYIQDAESKDFFMVFQAGNAPLQSLFRKSDLLQSKFLVEEELDFIEKQMKEQPFFMSFKQPSFLEHEIISSENKILPSDLVQKATNQCSQTLMAVNFLIQGNVTSSIRDYFDIPTEAIPFVMLEVEVNRITEESLPFFKEVLDCLDLIQLNTSPNMDHMLLMSLLETIHKQSSHKRPFIVLRVNPNMIDQYKSFKVLIDRVVIQNESTEESRAIQIDFSPLERFACKKLDTSYFMSAPNAYGPCRFLKGFSSSKLDIDSFYSEDMRVLKNSHLTLTLDRFKDCQACKHWYLPDTLPMFPTALILPEVPSPVFCSTLKDVAACQSFYTTLQNVLTTIRNHFEFLSTIVSPARKAASEYYLWRVFTYFNRFFLPLGDRFMELGEVNMALQSWEHVLRYDPTNALIHQKLDIVLKNPSV